MKDIIKALLPYALSAVRYGAAILGGWLVRKGQTDAAGCEAIIGGIVAAAAIGVSALERKLTGKKLKRAIAAPAGSAG